MTNDLSQCGNCIYHYTYNGRDMCKQVGDDFYLQWKVENCPYHTTITRAAAISDEIYRLRAENAALRERLGKKTVELPCKVGDTIYSLDHFDLKIRENKVIAITFLLSNSVNHLEVQAHNFRGAVASFESIDFGKDVFTDRSAAETRLAELKGEKE